ncbi:MAG: oxygenase MpaB family protein [Leadbetterella sp.]
MEKLGRFSFPSEGFSKYWQLPNGKRMLSMLSSVPTEKEISSFSKYYVQSDTVADSIVETEFISYGFRNAMAYIQDFWKKPSQNEGFSDLYQLLSDCSKEPDWLDHKKLNNGILFSQRSGNMGLMVLRNYCLLGGYESAAINKPLVYTAELKNIAVKRIAETLTFWVDVTETDALKVGENGFQAILKTRFIHSHARYQILKSGTWKTEEWGLPINSLDMMATNLGFSLVFLDGLRMLNLQPSQEEVEGLFHLWKYLGHLQGIPMELLPDTEEEAIRLLYIWTLNQPSGDKDSLALAQSLINLPWHMSSIGGRFNKWALYTANLAFMNFFLTQNALDSMQVPSSGWKWVPILISKLNARFLNPFKSDERYSKFVQKGRTEHEKARYLSGLELDAKSLFSNLRK